MGAVEASGISDVLRRAARRRKRNGIGWKRDDGVHNFAAQQVNGQSGTVRALGLKLERSRGPVVTIVIDHLEKPSAN